jgi:hypothetical protein
MEPLNELTGRLARDGYERGKPAHVSAAAYAADRAAARETTCPRCGLYLDCRAYRQPGGPNYRCIALCPRCNAGFEF